jgi:hypothetical protein
VQVNIEAWFDGTMDRVSGWYKRRTQIWLFAIGLGAAIAMNVNTITIAEHLAQDETARARMVELAERVAQARSANQSPPSPEGRQAPEAVEGQDDTATDTNLTIAQARNQVAMFRSELASVGVPIGWDHMPAPPEDANRFLFVLRQVAGLLLTAFAVTFGTPFWFDTLNKFMVIRSTVKPREKSQEEGSENRQSRTAAGASGQTTAAPRPAAGPAIAPPVPPNPALPVERHEWASGVADEGII